MSFSGFRKTQDVAGGDGGNNALGNDNGNSRTFDGSNNRDPWGNPIKDNSGGGGDNKNKQKTNDQNDGNDGSSIDDQVDSIWQDIKAGGDGGNKGGGGNNDNKGGVQQQQQQQVSPADQLKNYLKDQGLSELTLSDQEKEAVSGGDFTSLNNKVLTLVQQAHLKAMSNSAALMDAKITAAVEKAINDTKGLMSGEKALAALHSSLPFTKDPAIGPVAQTIMQRFVTRGATQEEAIKGVKLWFNKANKLSDPEGQANTNRNGNYRGSFNEGDEHMNWLDVLGPVNRQR